MKWETMIQGKQKSPPGKTDELGNIVAEKSQAINLTYLSRSETGWSWHLFHFVIPVLKRNDK
jgi:hypothetical protein